MDSNLDSHHDIPNQQTEFHGSVFSDLTALAKQNMLGAVAPSYPSQVRALSVALGMSDRSVLLVGASGIGKTSLVKHLAFLLLSADEKKPSRPAELTESIEPKEMIAEKDRNVLQDHSGASHSNHAIEASHVEQASEFPFRHAALFALGSEVQLLSSPLVSASSQPPKQGSKTGHHSCSSRFSIEEHLAPATQPNMASGSIHDVGTFDPTLDSCSSFLQSSKLKSKSIWRLDLVELVIKSKTVHEFESYLQVILKTAYRKRDEVLLFLDDIDVLSEYSELIEFDGKHEGKFKDPSKAPRSSASEGVVSKAKGVFAFPSIGNMSSNCHMHPHILGQLQSLLFKSEFQILASTTPEGHKNLIRNDPRLSPCFHDIQLREPTETETLHILHFMRPFLESRYDVQISDHALRATVKLSSMFLSHRTHPEKDIDLIVSTIMDPPRRLTSVSSTIVVVDEHGAARVTTDDGLGSNVVIEEKRRKQRGEGIFGSSAYASTAAGWQGLHSTIVDSEGHVSGVANLVPENGKRTAIAGQDGSTRPTIVVLDDDDKSKTSQASVPSKRSSLSTSRTSYISLDRPMILVSDIAKTASRWTGVSHSLILKSEQTRNVAFETEQSLSQLTQGNSVSRGANSQRANAGPFLISQIGGALRLYTTDLHI